MAYNTTDKQKRIEAANDLAAKLKLESQLIPPMQKYFNKVGKDFGNIYSEQGKIIDVNQYNDMLSNILSAHYEKTTNQFSSQIRNQLGTPDDNNFIQNRIDTHLQHNGMRAVEQNTQQISNTTHKHLHNAVGAAVIAAALIGKKLTNRQIALKAKRQFKEKSQGRLSIIAQDQTQFAAETSKFTEMDILANSGATIGNIVMDKAKKKKTWIAILDNVTRLWHAEADGQTVDTNDVFTVMGEKLRFPRDGSLGASSINLVNCRCSAIYSIIE